MEFKKILELGIKPIEGETLLKHLINIHIADEKNVLEIKRLFESHHYDISLVHGSFYKIFTKNEKEVAELSAILTEIDALDMQAIFQANLRFECFTKNFMLKLGICRDNNLPYLYEDNTFIAELFSEKAFMEYTKNVSESKEQEPSSNILSEEDLIVKSEILTKLREISEVNINDWTIQFLIKNIEENLDSVILADNKRYKELGTRHLVESALQGVNITPELQIELDEKILNAFVDVEGIKRGVA